MNSMKLVILLHSLYWSILTKDESKREPRLLSSLVWIDQCNEMKRNDKFHGIHAKLRADAAAKSWWRWICFWKRLKRSVLDVADRTHISPELLTAYVTGSDRTASDQQVLCRECECSLHTWIPQSRVWGEEKKPVQGAQLDAVPNMPTLQSTCQPPAKLLYSVIQQNCFSKKTNMEFTKHAKSWKSHCRRRQLRPLEYAACLSLPFNECVWPRTTSAQIGSI